MALETYNKKRDFSSTNEPRGKQKKQSRDLIFVIQYHKARAKHYDFRLEWNGVLLSWAVPKGLSLDPNQKRLAVHVEDHPIEYANFEGIIPKGNYGAGSVEIFDHGTYIPSYDVDYGLKKGHIKFVLQGQKYQGEWSLIRMDEKNWFIKKSDDEFAKINKKLAKNGKKSAKKSKLPFKTANVMLAKLTSRLPKDGWLFEIKYDGYRLLSFVQNGKVKCVTRGGQDYTKKFEEIANQLAQIDEENFVVDGEVVCFDEAGRSDFGLLQQHIKDKKQDMCYVIFDLLALNGKDLRDLPLIERKKLLKRLFSKEKSQLIYSQHVEDEGEACFKFAQKNNLEGVVAKQINSKYSGDRNGDWLKIKCYLRQEFVVCGYLTSQKNRVLSALLLGYYQNGKLIFAGKVGTGFDEAERQSLAKKLDKLKIKTCPFSKSLKTSADVIWAKPKLVAEIQFAEFTKENILRQPSFIGLRSDKKAEDVKLEVAEDDKN